MPFDDNDRKQIEADLLWLRKHPDKCPGPLQQIGDRYRKLYEVHGLASQAMLPMQGELAHLRTENERLREENRTMRDKLELPDSNRAPITELAAADELAQELTGTTPATARSSELRPEQVEADENAPEDDL
jgi:hypothetical protein